jgi:hypothetical protein
VSVREYVAPHAPLPPAVVEALARFLDGQSVIRAAYQVGLRARPWPTATVRTSDVLWFDIAGRRRGRVARWALSDGLTTELSMICRPGLGRNFVTQRTLAEAGSAVQVLWRAPDPVPGGLDPLAYELRWLPLRPPPGFAGEAAAVLERSPGIQRAYLIEEVLLKDGARVSSRSRIHFDSTDRRWPGDTVRELQDLCRREWRSFAVGKKPAFQPTTENATEIFRRTERAES